MVVIAPRPQFPLGSPSPRLQVSRNDWGSAPLLGALDMIFSAAQHSNAAIAEMVSILSWEWAWLGYALSLGPCIHRPCPGYLPHATSPCLWLPHPVPSGTLSRSWDPAQPRLKVCPISRSGCRACGMCTSAWAWRMTLWTPPTPCSERALFSRSLSAAATRWSATCSW